MSDSFGPSDPVFTTVGSGTGSDADLAGTIERTRNSTNALGISASALASAMTKAFTQATTGGKQFDDVLKSLALRMSSLTVAAAFKPIAKGLAGGLNDIFKSIFGGDTGTTGGSADKTPSGSILSAIGGIQPFATGGVIGAPSYFPRASGGFGLAGEAGPEAIMPLTRGPDGRLGVAMSGAGAPGNITVQIATPDAASFRRSEAYLTGQIARAVARGQRSL
jgi:phage-related minor tail protein